MNVEFFCKTRIVAGRGVLSCLRELNIRKMLVVCDPFFVKNHWVEQLTEYAGGPETMVFGEIAPDPSMALVAKGTECLTRFCPDTVVALGGGSAMDCAKAMVFFSEQSPRLVAIPTTSGSGSEVTDFAILTHDGVKHPLIDEKLRPDMAILEEELLKSLPAGLIADSGFDVLSHAAEAYVATGASPFTDALAENAFSGVLQNLPKSFAGDKGVRLELHCRATGAGIAFTRAGLGLCHALSHALGGCFHIPHGRLNAILLPAVIACNTEAREKYAILARRAGVGAESDTLAVRNLKNALCRLRRDLGLPQTLAEAGVAPGKLWENREKILHAALADPCCDTNPQPVTEKLALWVLREVAGDGR